MFIIKVFLWSMGILFFIGIVTSILSSSRKKQEMEARKQELEQMGALMEVGMYLIDGLNLPANSFCRLTLFNDHLVIKNASNTFKLNISQISGAYGKTNREIMEQEKSAVGRAIVGGAVLGPVGAIVGGLSGVGTKTKQILVHLMVITYKGSDNELKALVFKPEQNPDNPNPALDTIIKFEYAIKQLLPQSTEPEIIEL